MKSSRPVMALPRRSLPAMAKVRQQLPSDHIVDVRKDVRQKLLDSGLRDKVKPGQSNCDHRRKPRHRRLDRASVRNRGCGEVLRR